MGPQFFETIMGRRFFDGQFPTLLRSLERIGDQLEKLIVAQSQSSDENTRLRDEVAQLRWRCGLHLEYENAVNSAVVVDETSGATFYPRHADGLLGYRCVLKDGTETFITLVPSSSTDDGEPVVFSYFGSTGDPEEDSALCHCTMDPRKDADDE